MKPIPNLIVKDGHIVASARPARKTLVLGLFGSAAVLLAALGGYWMGQSGQGPDRQTRADTAATPAAVMPAPVPVAVSTLQSAVTDALREVAPGTDDEKRFVQAQQAYLQQKPETPEQIKARIDSLRADPQAQQQYNRNVLNRVTVEAPPRGRDAEIAQAVTASQQRSLPAADSAIAMMQAEASARESAGRTYVVQAGDTLWSISGRVYGDPHQFRRLYEANPRVLASPDHIYPGQVLRVPS